MTKGTTKLVYICHPYSDDPELNEFKVREICRAVVTSGAVPLGPQIYLPQFMDEGTQRKQAMEACLRLMRVCDEVWVYGHTLSDGMAQEVGLALDIGMPVFFAGAAKIIAL